MPMLTFPSKILTLLIVSIICILLVFLGDPISQDIKYHQFADQRFIFLIPNFNNVLSNLPIFFMGIIGFLKINRGNFNTKGHLLFFGGMILTGIGSTYYHLDPTNKTLVWDRIPMTISFMSIFSIIISEHIHVNIGKKLLPHFLFWGLLSVLYWNVSEEKGNGDLRFYVLIQFLPIVLIPFILILFPNKRYRSYYLMILVLYLAAKLFEFYDREIFDLLFISGHTLKHLIVSFVPLIVLLKTNQKKL